MLKPYCHPFIFAKTRSNVSRCGGWHNDEVVLALLTKYIALGVLICQLVVFIQKHNCNMTELPIPEHGWHFLHFFFFFYNLFIRLKFSFVQQFEVEEARLKYL